MICLDCAGDLRPVSGPRCYKCGKPVNGDEEYCRDCGAHPGAFDQGRGIFLYDDRMRYSIMKYKYFGCQEYSRFYGKALYIYGKDMLALWKPQIIIPVPLHRRKQRIRGFNQAELLAKELSRYAGIPVDTAILKKCHATRSQKKLDAAERKKNLQKAFFYLLFPIHSVRKYTWDAPFSSRSFASTSMVLPVVYTSSCMSIAFQL